MQISRLTWRAPCRSEIDETCLVRWQAVKYTVEFYIPSYNQFDIFSSEAEVANDIPLTLWTSFKFGPGMLRGWLLFLKMTLNQAW
jgi:hypothetical protein